MRKSTETTPHRPDDNEYRCVFKPHPELHRGISAAVLFRLYLEGVAAHGRASSSLAFGTIIKGFYKQIQMLIKTLFLFVLGGDTHS